MRPSPSSQSILALTGLRGYAALWVLLSHLSFTDTFSAAVGQRLEWTRANGLLRHEYLAVDLFFVLSGFVLTHSHARELDERLDRGTYVRFLLLRLARVYPLHLVALFGVLLIHQFVPSQSPTDTPGCFALQVGLMASWGFCRGLSWNAPAWSLSSEWLAYLVLPLLILVTAGFRRLRVQLVALGLVLALFAGLFFSYQFHLIQYSDGYGATGRVLVGVAVGSILRRLYDQPSVRRLPWTLLFWLAVPVAAACMTDLGGRRLDNNVWAYFSVVFLVFAAACAPARGLAPFTMRGAVYLGEISYAVYIFHYPVLRALGLLAGSRFDVIAHDASPWRARLVILGAMFVVLAVAALAHHLIEEPVRRRARRWIDVRFPNGARAVAPRPSPDAVDQGKSGPRSSPLSGDGGAPRRCAP